MVAKSVSNLKSDEDQLHICRTKTKETMQPTVLFEFKYKLRK